RAVRNRLLWMQEAFGLGPEDRVLQKTPFSFDVSVWEFFWPLMTGARLVVAKPEGHKDPAYLVDTIAKRGVTTMHFVPSMLAVFLDANDVSRCTSLRHVVSSGEALPYELVVRFHRALGAQLHNLYGPTEAAVDVSHFTCERKGPPVVPIGRPIANLRLYVLDPNMEPVPIGSPGEVHIGGIGVGRGYLRRPGLTAERFVPDPFAPEPGGRLYKTGDLGRVRGDGSIEYLGRIDHQVKLRGFRIELGEIETVLMSHPSVHGATVIVRQVGNDQGLVAYVVAARGQAAEPAALRGHLKAKLPEYMVPSAFVMLAKLPLTPNGKIDRKALPAPEVGPIADYVAPRTPAELSLAQIFADVLKVPAIGIHDDFFLLGGHSLLAVQLIAVIEERLGTRLPVAALFGASTVAALAREIEPGERAPSQTALIPLRAHGRRPPLVCIHPGGGTIFCYQALVSRLAPDRPVFGLVARGLAAGESPAESVEDMAKAYVSAVVGACPGGPVHLMGWSFGGLVALEMTRLLCAAGHDVASTTMIDTMAPSLPMVPERDVHPMAMLAAFAQDLGIDVDEEELVPLAPEDALARVVALGKKRGRIPSHLGADEIARRVLVFSTNARASARYAPPNLDGKIVLIRAADQSAADDVNPAEGWSRIFPHNLEVCEAPGTHYTMVIPPHVDVLARHLDDIFAAR
ncbi:MAG TPA: alpha/beta fold hydrolase, partial [Kofleriaceae bacterium]|nr:alpha/beta fold hydrolase [Kofleriaceae bacterium]